MSRRKNSSSDGCLMYIIPLCIIFAPILWVLKILSENLVAILIAVFSEIFYNKGWRAYVDGVECPYFRADYVLRAMVLPEGEHDVEWRFRAPKWRLVEGVTAAFSAVILLGVVAMIIVTIRKKRGSKDGE